jgi:hypothetical protein
MFKRQQQSVKVRRSVQEYNKIFVGVSFFFGINTKEVALVPLQHYEGILGTWKYNYMHCRSQNFTLHPKGSNLSLWYLQDRKMGGPQNCQQIITK